jgi:hypothetical protein
VVKHLQVVLWGVASSLKLVDVVQWAHKGDELTRNNPVEVSVLYFFIIFIFFVIEFFETVPT